MTGISPVKLNPYGRCPYSAFERPGDLPEKSPARIFISSLLPVDHDRLLALATRHIGLTVFNKYDHWGRTFDISARAIIGRLKREAHVRSRLR